MKLNDRIRELIAGANGYFQRTRSPRRQKLANWPVRAREMDELEDAGRLPGRTRFVMFIIPWMQLVASVPRITTIESLFALATDGDNFLGFDCLVTRATFRV
jgi:hypothetical protein